jgi:hypothetical protein
MSAVSASTLVAARRMRAALVVEHAAFALGEHLDEQLDGAQRSSDVVREPRGCGAEFVERAAQAGGAPLYLFFKEVRQPPLLIEHFFQPVLPRFLGAHQPSPGALHGDHARIFFGGGQHDEDRLVVGAQPVENVVGRRVLGGAPPGSVTREVGEDARARVAEGGDSVELNQAFERAALLVHHGAILGARLAQRGGGVGQALFGPHDHHPGAQQILGRRGDHLTRTKIRRCPRSPARCRCPASAARYRSSRA